MQILNRVKTQTHDIEHRDGKTYYRCSVCCRQLFRKKTLNHKVYCSKHYNQVKKYRHPLDNNPRTVLDKNEIIIAGNTAYIKLYDNANNPIATARIDVEDVPKVRYTKWRLAKNGYVVSNSKYGLNTSNLLHKVVLNTNNAVDHIDHDPLNNRKCNLIMLPTITGYSMNQDFKGAVQNSNGSWQARIKVNNRTINLGKYLDKAEALYARWYAEQVLFKEYAYPKPEPEILESRKSQIQEYVNRKAQRL